MGLRLRKWRGPGCRSWGRFTCRGPLSFSVRSWNSGARTVAILGLDLDPAHIFEATVTGDMLLSGFPPLFFVVIVLCAVFVGFELISFMIGLLVSRRITTAVRGLYEGTEAIRAGRTDFRVEEKARDQLGELGRSFNTMARSIEMLMDEEREKERIETETVHGPGGAGPFHTQCTAAKGSA